MERLLVIAVLLFAAAVVALSLVLYALETVIDMWKEWRVRRRLAAEHLEEQ